MAVAKYAPIDCGDYDYLEIACMDQYDVEISSQNETYSGVAVNLEIDTGEEFLVLKGGDSSPRRIRVDRIDRMIVKSRPCRFQEHEFRRNVSDP